MEAPSLNPALRELLTKIQRGKADVVPPGWRIASEWATEWGITGSTARHHLKRMVDNGLMECREFRVPSGNNAKFTLRHYKLLA